MNKIINIFTRRKYDAYAVDCQFCEIRHDCKSTDAQTCLRKDHVQKVDLSALNVQGYKWVVMLRDHYRGNDKGEYFAASDYDRIKRTQPYWFTNTDHPIHTVILTNDDVPSIIAKRCEIINKIQNLTVLADRLNRPTKGFDGRKTRKTAPELFAEWDKRVDAYCKQKGALIDKKTDAMSALQDLPKYSTTLLRII